MRKGIGGNENQIAYPTYEELKKCMPKDVAEDTEYTYLFAVDDKSYYLGKKENVGILSEQMGYEWIDHQDPVTINNSNNHSRTDLRKFHQSTLRTLHHSFHMICLHRISTSPTELVILIPSGKLPTCDSCKGLILWRYTSKLLMSKYAGREYKKYALLAGFTEIGETLEETVSREVMEEVGLKVKNITYYKNQPWAFSDTLLMGFFCELDGSDQVKLDENELALAEWFERNQIPVEPDDISLTNEMMMVFRDGYTI